MKSVSEKLRVRDGLVWTAGLIVDVKRIFRDGLVWTVGLIVEIKLRFRDGLVWTVGLTVEIKLRFRYGLVWTVGLTVEIKLRFSWRISVDGGLTVEIKLRFQTMDEASFKDNIFQYTLPPVSNLLPLNVKIPVENLQELAAQKHWLSLIPTGHCLLRLQK